MGLTMEMRKGFAREKAKRYRQGSKKKKGQLIEEYMELVGCTRHHAAWTLRCWGITVWEQHAGRPVKIVVGRRRSRQRTARIYDQQTVAALTIVVSFLCAVLMWNMLWFLQSIIISPAGS